MTASFSSDFTSNFRRASGLERCRIILAIPFTAIFLATLYAAARIAGVTEADEQR